VTGGSGHAVIVATGMQTEIGTIQALVGTARPPQTPMQQQLDDMGTRLALLSAGICAAVFGIGLIRGYDWMQMLKASLSLAVAAVPEGLPAVATTTLALGIHKSREQQILIRHLDAVEALGAVQVFCLDKTGTLTENRMRVVAVFADMESLCVKDGRFLMPIGRIHETKQSSLQRLLEIVSLCNEVQSNGPPQAPMLEGSPTENALLELALANGVNVTELRLTHPLSKVQYRAEGRHYMSTLHRRKDDRWLLAVKGSPVQLLRLCRYHVWNKAIVRLNPENREAIFSANERMASDALRVLGVAYAELEPEETFPESGLIWLGLVGMADPLRPGMRALMKTFHDASIDTVMITGDQGSTAYAVGRELDLGRGRPLEILEAPNLQDLEPELLAGLVDKVEVIARVSPAHKLRIVQALQHTGRVVAMTGDGINDGPALKAANVGVAMGHTGTDVARSVSDVVLEDDNLHTMINAVRQGRTIYGNIRKALHFLLSTNLSEIEVMLAGIALGAGEPLSPMQLLWINLISDIFPGLALALEPSEYDVMQRPPRDPEEPIILTRDLVRMGVESAVITGGTLASYAYALSRYGAGPRASSQAFMTLTTAQLIHALSCRSPHTTFFRPGKRRRNTYLEVALGASLLVQGMASLLPGLRKLLGISPVNLLDAVVIGAGAVGPLLINEATKGLGRYAEEETE
jgi:Ca2+-transporting ATPase